MNKLNDFKKSHEEALAAIQMFSEPTKYNPPMDGLVRWMLETEANPYGYLPNNGNALGSAESFAGLLYSISHALYDDGDITFVSVNGEPRIIFAHRIEDNIRKIALTSQEQDFEKNPIFDESPVNYDVEVLDIEPNQFGQLYEEYLVNHRKAWEDFEAAMEW